ncbi:MAG: geranylgeranyl reductase family protein [Bernardetiaceae bacterium]
MSLEYDLIVVGSGVSGSMTAYRAAQAGLRVAILEKETLPRYKTCGGGLTYQARQLLPDLPPEVLEYEGYEVDLHFIQQDRTYRVRREQPVVSMAMRANLDQFIAQQAQNAGAILHDQTRFEGATPTGKGWNVQTSQGKISTQYIIAADGANSLVAKQLGWKKETRLMARATEYEVYVSPEEQARLSERTRIDFEGIPAGYAWVFPKRDHLSIGLGMFMGTRKTQKENLHQRTAEYMDWLGIRSPREVARHAAQIPVSPRTDGFARQGVFLVGDAAGLADPITAEGISNALLSGRWAVEAILAAEGESTQAEALYHQQLEQKLLPSLNKGRKLAWVMYQKPKWRNWLFEQQGQRLAENFTDLMMGRRGYPDAKAVLQRIAQKFF